MLRKRIATNVKSPNINRFTSKTLRPFMGTMEHYRINNVLHVMEVLGHETIKGALVYTPHHVRNRRIRSKSREDCRGRL